MTLGDKLAKLRKANNITQEQLAAMLDVSRQAVSKWESGLTRPETNKLIRIGELFNCSLDYLLNDSADEPQPDRRTDAYGQPFRAVFRERKSERTLFGMPLWHVGKDARGIIAVGLRARGVVAIGLRATGIISLGLVSFGVLALGMLATGLFAAGILALGLAAAGCFALGILAMGAISLGVVSLGAVAIGDFSIGALALGRYAALGDNARAMVAIGHSEAVGSAFKTVEALTAQDMQTIDGLLKANVPSRLAWASDFFMMLLS